MGDEFFRCVTFDNDKGLKFWEVRVTGCDVTSREGFVPRRDGYQWKTKSFATPEKAQASGLKRYENKIGKGAADATLDANGDIVVWEPESFEDFFGVFRSVLAGSVTYEALNHKLHPLYEEVYARYPERTEQELDAYLHEAFAALPWNWFGAYVHIREYLTHPSNKWGAGSVVRSNDAQREHPFARFTRSFSLFFDGRNFYSQRYGHLERPPDEEPEELFKPIMNARAYSQSDVFRRLERLHLSFQNASPDHLYYVALDKSDIRTLLAAASKLKHLHMSEDVLKFSGWDVFQEEGVSSIETLQIGGHQDSWLDCVDDVLNGASQPNLRTLIIASYSYTISNLVDDAQCGRDLARGLHHIELICPREEADEKVGERLAELSCFENLKTLTLCTFTQDLLRGWCTPDAKMRVDQLILRRTRPTSELLAFFASLQDWAFEEVVLDGGADIEARFPEELSFIEEAGLPIRLQALEAS